MFNPLLNLLVLRGMSMFAMGKAYLRYRNPRRRAIGRHHRACYERAWREAAGEMGATFKSLGQGIVEMELDGVATRAVENTSAIDDPVTLAVLIDKLLTYRILKEEGLPIARHAEFSLGKTAAAVDFLERAEREYVVNAASGTGGGLGITTGIRTRWQLA